MKDFGPILIVAILRAPIQQVPESPAIDPAHHGIAEFERVKKQTDPEAPDKEPFGAAWNSLIGR